VVKIFWFFFPCAITNSPWVLTITKKIL
jgi:hypothetical protein